MTRFSGSGAFQSAPLTKARGDAGATRPYGPVKGFNPLPSQKQGETCSRKKRAPLRASFNPLPSQKQGETHRGLCAGLS